MVVAVGFHVAVLCFYEVVLLYLIRLCFENCFPVVIFCQITHTLVACVVGAGPGKHGALKVVFHWLFSCFPVRYTVVVSAHTVVMCVVL